MFCNKNSFFHCLCVTALDACPTGAVLASKPGKLPDTADAAQARRHKEGVSACCSQLHVAQQFICFLTALSASPCLHHFIKLVAGTVNTDSGAVIVSGLLCWPVPRS